jgi:hypothetical protein
MSKYQYFGAAHEAAWIVGIYSLASYRRRGESSNSNIFYLVRHAQVFIVKERILPDRA